MTECHRIHPKWPQNPFPFHRFRPTKRFSMSSECTAAAAEQMHGFSPPPPLPPPPPDGRFVRCTCTPARSEPARKYRPDGWGAYRVKKAVKPSTPSTFASFSLLHFSDEIIARISTYWTDHPLGLPSAAHNRRTWRAMGSGRDIALRTFRRFHPDRLAALIALVMLGGDWRRWGVGVTKVDDVPIHCAFNFLREWDAGRAWCAALQHARTWKQTMSAQALVEKAPWPYIFKDDLVEGSGLTPLCLAVDMGLSPTYLQPFLTNGATIDAPSRDKSTPLTIGARKGFTATVSFLLAAGANPNTATLTRATPLILASRYGHADAVALLLAAGADTTRAESGGMTAILWASRAGHLVAVTHLITWGTSVHTATREGDTPLLFASMRGHALVVAALLAAGADPNTRSNAGTTSLILACHGPHADCARLLLDAGADPCTADNAGTTPVIVACQSGSTAILSMLVAAGVHLSGAQGGAALFMAAMNAQVDTVRALLEIGVDVASRVLVPGRSRAGAERPLFGAVYGGSPEIVQALVDAGADVRGPSGEEALRTARYFCRRDVEKVLRLAGAGGELDGEWSE